MFYLTRASVASVGFRLLSRQKTIDKVGQLFGRGLVSEDNRLMKSLNDDTCHLSRHDCDVKKMADDKHADVLMLLYFFDCETT